MIKRTVTYEDYNGEKRTETFYFHYTEAEILDMEMSEEGSFAERIQRIIDAKDNTALMKLIKKFVIDAYGVKSDDGKRFMKNDEVKAAFLECPAYSDIFMDMVTDEDIAAEFVNGVIPNTMKDRVAKLTIKKSDN